MPEPKYSDLLEDESLSIGDVEATSILCKLADRQTSLAYWQGRCETLEQVISEIKAAHRREIDSIIGANDVVLGYLKDRLNRLEVGSVAERPSAYDDE